MGGGDSARLPVALVVKVLSKHMLPVRRERMVRVFSNFSISFFIDVLSQAFIKSIRKVFVYRYINNMYNIYILENVWIFA